MIEFLRGYDGYLGDWLIEMSIASLRTLELMLVSFCLAAGIGLVIALLRISRLAPLSAFAKLYIGFFRGVPVLVILYWIYFALPEMGYQVLVISSYTAAVLGLGIHGGAFLAEVFRSGIESLHRGQMEAALSLGLTPVKAMGHIILPQAVRVAQGDGAVLDHRGAGADAARQGSGVVVVPADARVRARRGVLLPHELSADARGRVSRGQDGAGAMIPAGGPSRR
jgi:His/Glu/Gln/Arg/opine family amino acid ABC transporter permease subunit